MKALFILIAAALPAAQTPALVTDGEPLPDDVVALAKCVAQINRGTGVYVGGRRIVTAHHVGAGPAAFAAGDPVRFVAGSWRRIGGSDLAVFRLAAEPPVPTVTIAIATAGPKVGERVWFVATGWRRGPKIVRPAGSLACWSFDRTRGTLAGLATVSAAARPCPKLSVPSVCFSTLQGAKAAPGDSGGGAFVWRAGRWELVGILSHADALVTERGESAIFSADATSYAVDLASYRALLLDALGLAPRLPAVPLGTLPSR